jgi:hypothetical protein
MRITSVGLALMLVALAAAPAPAELRHVQIKTLGMD